MDAHFSKDTLLRDVEALSNRTSADGSTDTAGRSIVAESRFDDAHTVQQQAYLAHLSQHGSD